MKENTASKKNIKDRDLIARAIVVQDGAILVNRSRNAKTNEEYFALPGGHIDPGESTVDALVREFEEELDAKVAVYDLCFVSESIYAGRRKSETQRHELVLYFHADLASELKSNGKEIFSPEKDKNFQWLALENLPTSNLLPESIKDYLMAIMAEVETQNYEFSDSTIKVDVRIDDVNIDALIDKNLDLNGLEKPDA